MDSMLSVCLTIVQQGTFDEFLGNESIEEVFSAFFEQPRWRAVYLEDRYCVGFSGRACFDEVDSLYNFLFAVEPDSARFDIISVRVEGVSLTGEEIDELIDDIYYAYSGGGAELDPAEEAELAEDLADCEDIVRTGSFDELPLVTVDELFEFFFADGEWEPTLGDDGYVYVNYNGIAEFNGVRSVFLFQFAVSDDGEYFEVSGLEIGDRAMSEQEIDAVLLDIFQAYQRE